MLPCATYQEVCMAQLVPEHFSAGAVLCKACAHATLLCIRAVQQGATSMCLELVDHVQHVCINVLIAAADDVAGLLGMQYSAETRTAAMAPNMLWQSH